MKRPKSSSSAHHKKIPQEKFTPLSHSSTNLQVVPPPGGFSRSSSHPLFNFLYGLPNSPILILPSYPGQFPSIHTRILYHLTHLRKLEKSDNLCIRIYILRGLCPSVGGGTSLRMDSDLNLPADGASAQHYNVRVHSILGISVSAFDPCWTVPIGGLEVL